MADFNRKHWLAIRATPSLGRLQRERGVLIHMSADSGMIPDPRGKSFPWIPWRTPKGEGVTYNIGRNKAKREHRASKSSRKFWRRVA